jgi:DNA mismatch repair protein MutS2
MSFCCEPSALARLEWPRLVERLAAGASTRRGTEACARDLFAPDAVAARERLAETSEARALLDAGESIPFGGVADLRALLASLVRGETPTGSDLLAVLETLRGGRRIRGWLGERAARAPRLAALAATIRPLAAQEDHLARALTPEGSLRDDASPVLARAQREARRLEGEIERRMAQWLRDPAVVPHLQDQYSTFRESRPVLPVRAESRRSVRGIVHDISASGETVFIEPEDVVELGNRLRLALLSVERETERILRELGAQVAQESLELEAQGATLEKLDRAQACGRLSARLEATAPELCDGGSLELRELRHPLLLLESGLEREQVVANDVVLPAGARGLVISGPNAGGKTVLAKAVGLAVLCARAGLHVACAPGSRLPSFDALHADIGDEQDLRAGLSTFSARMRHVAGLLDGADARTLAILDEVGEGTEPGEGAALAQAVLEGLVARGAHVIATTHFNRLKELAGSDPRFANASAEFDRATLLPTYRVHLGAPGSSGATWVAERMGVAPPVVERARELLDREDRRLEALTTSLSELRQELEAERRQAVAVRAQSEQARAEYEARLASLRAAREQALAAMKADLELAYRTARAEIARAVRELQQGGEAPAGRAANLAHRRVERARERVASVEVKQAQAEPPPPPRPAIDERRLVPGALVTLDGMRGEATVLEAPDARGRLAVRLGGARIAVTASRVTSVRAPAARAGGHQIVRAPDRERASAECDLRGMRVDEALERAEAHLQRALGTDVSRVLLIHGHGTGALRSALRAWLRGMPGVAEFAPAAANEGGNGVTVVTLAQ